MDISGVSLRSMRDEDLLEVNCWPPYEGDHAQMDYALRQNGWLREYYNRPGSLCFTAEDGDEIVGIVLLIMGGPKDAEVRIAIHPAKTRRGFGLRIMTAVMETGFLEQGLDTIRLVVRKNNFSAMALYERLGFRNRGECTLLIQTVPVEFFKMDTHKQEFKVLRDEEQTNENRVTSYRHTK